MAFLSQKLGFKTARVGKKKFAPIAKALKENETKIFGRELLALFEG